MTGQDLENTSDEELIKVVENCSVFARVQPEHKTRIVKALKKLNYIVAMTGDGVNDAPSIKSADIGVSMGITGTDVTKSASDMVLADDNFATIVNAVEEGRKIYDNIRKVLQFQLATNISEVIYIFVASVLGITISTPAQLLWINLVTDSTPGLALGMEKAEGNVMHREPRKSNESVFAHGAAPAIAIHGLIMAFLAISAFFIGHYVETGVIEITESKDGMTMAFLVVNFIQLFYAIDMRSQRESIFTLEHRNFWLLGSALVTTLLTLSVVYVPPLSQLFGLAEISIQEFGLSIILAFLIIPITEIYKVIERKVSK
jgi:Ca2+-transporting ATPase